MSKALILCHPKIVLVDKNGRIINHWYSNVMLEDFSNFIIDTVDIKEGGTYVKDCFSDDFINSHTDEYDLLLSPDAGGKWYTYQDNKDYQSFRKMIIDLLRLLKQTCIVIFDKFMYSEFRDITIEVLQEHGFTIIPKVYNMYGRGNYTQFIYAERI